MEDGYYHVKYYDEWEIAQLDRGVWWVTASEHPRREDDFEEIGPKIEPPTDQVTGEP